MTWTHVLIFWLVVAVCILTVKNIWLRFSLSVMRNWQSKAMLAIARSISQAKKGEPTDDVLDSDVIQ